MRSESFQLSLTLCDPMHCSPPGSSVDGILQARILEWVAISSCRESFQYRDWTWVSYVSYIGSKLFTTNATWEAPVLYNRSFLVICSILNIVVCIYSQQWTLRCMYPFKLWFSSDICPGMGLIDHMVQISHSIVSDSVTAWTAAHQASLSISNYWSPPKPMSIVLVMPSNHLILCRPLLLLPSIFPSISIFSKESALHITWPKYWSFSFSISPSREHPGLISFRMDWLDLLAVQGTLKSLLQHHSSKASIFLPSAFFIVQLSHP